MKKEEFCYHILYFGDRRSVYARYVGIVSFDS
jgi:hypothetical protein